MAAARQTERRVLGSLERSLQALTIGSVRAREARSRMLDPISAGNMIQYRQVPISGYVGKRPTYQDITVDWPYAIANAPAQTDGDTERPTFSSGVELLTDTIIIIQVQLRTWVNDENESATGAVLRVSAWAPEAKKKQEFRAMLHLTFAGWGVPDEGDEDDDEELDTE